MTKWMDTVFAETLSQNTTYLLPPEKSKFEIVSIPVTAVGGKNCPTYNLKYLPPTDGYNFEFGLFEERGSRPTN